MIAAAGVSLLESGQFTLLAAANIAAGTALIRFGVKEWRLAAGEKTNGV